jgi:metallo-beta-lactamase family protein
MHIKFCGAAGEVTGSSHLITLDDGFKILLDCGLFQGDDEAMRPKNENWHFQPKEIDCLILSHAHIDHTGRVPKLVKDGFRGNIYATHATRSLCGIMLLDSAMIQERDAEFYNSKIDRKKVKGKKNYKHPLYGQEDVKNTMNKFVSFGYDSWQHIHPRVKIIFVDAGHILGSAGMVLAIKDKNRELRIAFTGDIGRPDRPIIRDPRPLPESDYLITESLYGDRMHESGPEQSDRFLEVIKHTCLEKKGKLIIPAFSVGRTQEIVYMLDKMENAGMLPHLPVYVDSPLAVDATEVYGAHPECFDSDLHKYMLTDSNPFGFHALKYIRDVEESKRLNQSSEPSIIISASGMMNAGRVVHHLRNNVDNWRNTFLIVGYCAPGTNGALLRSGVENIKLFGEWKPVNAEIMVMDSFSAHGDQKEMFDVIGVHKDRARQTFLVHGMQKRQEIFADFLTSKGFQNVSIPKEGERFDLEF